MAKLERKAYATYVNANMGTGSDDWYLVGKDIDEMSVDMSPDVETKENILGETSVTDNGYEVTIEADPYVANPEDAIYEPLVDIAMNRKKAGACRTTYLEVIVEDTANTDHKAWKEDCVIKPNSYGGDTSGFQIPFTIYPDGNRVEGTVKLTAGVPTFTPN